MASTHADSIDARAADAPQSRRRGELIFATVVSIALVSGSFGTGKLYPFEAPSFFVASARHYCQFRLTDPRSVELPLLELGLGDFYAGQAGYAVGMPGQEAGAIRFPDSINVYGEVPSREKVTAAVQRALRDRAGPEHVVVSQDVIGAVDQHAVGLIASHRWRVSRVAETKAK